MIPCGGFNCATNQMMKPDYGESILEEAGTHIQFPWELCPAGILGGGEQHYLYIGPEAEGQENI